MASTSSVERFVAGHTQSWTDQWHTTAEHYFTAESDPVFSNPPARERTELEKLGTMLWKASPDVAKARSIVEGAKRVDINYSKVDSDGNEGPLLLWCATSGYWESIRFILSLHPDVNIMGPACRLRAKKGAMRTALGTCMYRCQDSAGGKAIVSELLSMYANPLIGPQGESPLERCLGNDTFPNVKEAVLNGPPGMAHVVPKGVTGVSVLRAAARYYEREKPELLFVLESNPYHPMVEASYPYNIEKFIPCTLADTILLYGAGQRRDSTKASLTLTDVEVSMEECPPLPVTNGKSPVAVNVLLLGGKNLKAADLNGKSDPFVRVFVDGAETAKYKSKVVKKTLNPEWNEKVFSGACSQLRFEVWDKDTLSKDDPLGHATLTAMAMQEAGLTLGHPVDITLALQDVSRGEISLRCTLQNSAAVRLTTSVFSSAPAQSQVSGDFNGTVRKVEITGVVAREAEEKLANIDLCFQGGPGFDSTIATGSVSLTAEHAQGDGERVEVPLLADGKQVATVSGLLRFAACTVKAPPHRIPVADVACMPGWWSKSMHLYGEGPVWTNVSISYHGGLEGIEAHVASIDPVVLSRLYLHLRAAVQAGDQDVVERLTPYFGLLQSKLKEHYGRVKHTEGVHWTLLHVASEKKGPYWATVLERLIALGCNINAKPVGTKNNNGAMPLHLAAEAGAVENVECLISHGADVNDKNARDETPLVCACKKGRVEVVKLLLEKGADSTAVPASAESDWAIKDSDKENVMQCLSLVRA